MIDHPLLKRSGRWATLGLSLAAGLGPALAHPPFGVLPGILGYGLLLHLLGRVDAEKPLKSAFWRGWLAGAAYFLVSTWWVGEAFLVDVAEHGWQAPFAIGFLAGGLGLLWGAAALAYRVIAPAGPMRVLTFAAVFAVFEWLRGHILTGFPWDLPGETWRAGGWISQAASVVGAYGLSLITLAVAASVAVWGGAESVRTKGVITGLALATLAGLAVFGAIRLSTPTRFTALNLRIVQADIEQADKWSPEEFRAIYDAYTSLTAEPPIGGQPMPQVVLWPEGAIPADSAEFLAGATWTHDALMAALRPGQILIMGAERSDGDGSDPRYYNSALALRRDASGLTTVGVYDKHHLVPFGEYMPMAPVMKAIGFEALVHMGDGFTAGPRPATLTPPGLPGVEPLICYESLFPDFASGTPRAHWIANLSNDAWFGKTSGPWQHLNLASYRAIEAGLPMVRATPTGVSAVIDAYGRPLKTLGQGVRGVIDARLPQAIVAPAYRTLGEGPFWLAIVVILAAPAWRLLKVRFGERAG